jgi:hypothetical protein
MFAAQGTAHNLNSIGVLIVLVATMLVVFWRTMIKLMIMMLAITGITLLSLGAIVLTQSMQHMIR